MSLIPLLLSDWEYSKCPYRSLTRDFRLEQLPSKTTVSLFLDTSPRRQRRVSNDDYLATMRPTVDKDGHTRTILVVDVQHFEPHEIEVKVVDDRYVVVTGKHEDKRDEHGWVSRQFSRRCLVPDDCDAEQLTPSLSSDGMLSIVVPEKRSPKDEGVERTVEIAYTSKPFENKPKKINVERSDCPREPKGA